MAASVADVLRAVLLAGAFSIVLFVGWSTRRF
jgi:hypothetical protein